MAIPFPVISEGTRVRIVQGPFPQDPALTGRTGVVIASNEYSTHNIGVVLDGENAPRSFAPQELEPTEAIALPPERQAAKRLRALP